MHLYNMYNDALIQHVQRCTYITCTTMHIPNWNLGYSMSGK